MIQSHLIIIGAMKAGTTSLYTALAGHPDLVCGPRKELNYFTTKRWRGPEKYAALFPDPPERSVVTLDASPAYAKLKPDSTLPRRIAGLPRPVHLVYLLRDPVERAVSHVRHNLGRGRVGAKDLTRIRLRHYVQTSLYSAQIRAYAKAGLADRLLLLDFETLCRDPNAAVAAVCRHAGLSPHAVPGPVHANASALPAEVVEGLDLVTLRAGLRGERRRMIERHGFAPARHWARLGRGAPEAAAEATAPADPAA